MNEPSLPIALAMGNLRKHLLDCVPALEQILTEFPTPNIQLVFPSLSMIESGQQFTNEMPYELTVCPPGGTAAQGKVVWIAGQWDYKMQLDLWCRSVPERDLILHRVFKALNPKVNPMGLSLILPDYYNLWARFDVDGIENIDGEQGSQRGEWRTKISVLGSLKQVLETQESWITKPIVNQTEILDTHQDIGT